MVETYEVYVVTHVVMADSMNDAVAQALDTTDISDLPIQYRNRRGVGEVLEMAS